MLSSTEPAIKCEAELPLNLKTHESASMFPSTTPPGSPSLGQVPEHLLMAVNNITSHSPISTNSITPNSDNSTSITTATNLATNLANSIANSIANTNVPSTNGSNSHGCNPLQQQNHTQNKMSPTSNSISSGSVFTPPNNVNVNHLGNISNLSNIASMANIAAANRMNSPLANAFNNVSTVSSNGGSASSTPVNNIPTSCNSTYLDHNGQPSPVPFSPPNGTGSFPPPRKSPPVGNQGFNHMTSHVTSLPSSIGRLTLGLTGHYPPSPIPEHEDMRSPVSSGGGMSPPLSPPPPSSPAPTMVPPLNSTERRENLSSSSPGNGGLAGLHHALHGLHNLHNLHNLHSLQNLQTQMAALAGLQGSLGVPGVSSLLHSHLAAQHSPGPAPENIASSLPTNVNSGSPSNNQNGGSQGSVPQMVLTAGQVAQGVQGAQLLIPTSQGIAVQPILTIPLGQAGSMNAASSLVNPLTPLHHLHSQQQSQHQQPQHHQSHHQQSRSGSTASSPLPASSSSSSSSTSSHPLLGLAGLPPSLFHPHHGSHNNNNNNSTNNNNLGSSEKPKLPLPLSSPVQDSISSLSARLGGAHYPHHHAPPPSRYSPDFLDTHNQPTISQSTGNVVDGVNLDEIKEFAKAFKIRRLSLGLTQTQVGQALSITEGPAYSQSAICRYKNGQHTLTDFMGNEPSKKRKRRTSFTPQALEVLNAHFERNTHPSGAEITALAEQLGYEREVVRIWFCNKRQALKNTVRMMAKGTPAPPPPPPPPPHSSIN